MKHLFTLSILLLSVLAKAQTVCDSLEFVSVQYSPFTDSVVVVEVMNHNSNEIFDYPGFVLLDTNGDTVALETVNYFGIGETSIHSLNVRAGAHDPTTNFEGTLKLYSGFFEDFECEWDLDQTLCADSPCDSLIIGFQNWGGALVLGDFAWSVLDSTNTVIESGVLTMTANEQYWFRGFCLTPATYTYTLYALGQPSGGGPTMTASSNRWYGSAEISQYFDWNSGNTLEIPFFDFCISESSPNGIEDHQEGSLAISRMGEQIIVSSKTVVKHLEILSADGKLVGNFNPNSDRFVLPANLTNGLYILRTETENGLSVIKFVR